ncbi:MAG: hypothetical protein KDA32_06230, partial [Phycisphaerales bacterium]|nr:hypothetical protein [Phycisphaerales bacterium]
MTRPGPVEVIVTGGQTGVDRAAMDFAIEVGIPLCGWIPQGRLDEHGVIPARYPGLVESDDADPGVRTRLNVRDSDGTLIIARGQLAGGTRLTAEEAARLNRPLIALDPDARDVL